VVGKTVNAACPCLRSITAKNKASPKGLAAMDGGQLSADVPTVQGPYDQPRHDLPAPAFSQRLVAAISLNSPPSFLALAEPLSEAFPYSGGNYRRLAWLISDRGPGAPGSNVFGIAQRFPVFLRLKKVLILDEAIVRVGGRA